MVHGEVNLYSCLNKQQSSYIWLYFLIQKHNQKCLRSGHDSVGLKSDDGSASFVYFFKFIKLSDSEKVGDYVESVDSSDSTDFPESTDSVAKLCSKTP